jgi:hypothetical protein
MIWRILAQCEGKSAAFNRSAKVFRDCLKFSFTFLMKALWNPQHDKAAKQSLQE